MGVHLLWSILDDLDLAEKKPLSFLSGKRVAVDLSGWVVQALQCKGLNESRNPHIRNLFFRVSCLLENNVHPIFVMEGKVPALKEKAFRERNHEPFSRESSTNGVSRAKFNGLLNKCHVLLNSLGIACVKSSFEAEAYCAFLCANKIVDGVITEDNDAFLYGAHTVFRDFTITKNDSHVQVYSLNSEKNAYGFDRSKLVALALLLGCDYTSGVPGIGKEYAMKLIKNLQNQDLLNRFCDWKLKSESELFPDYDFRLQKKLSHCNHCLHAGTQLRHKNEGCERCDSDVKGCISDSPNKCDCSSCKNTELEVKYKAEIKIYKATKDLKEFPNKEVINEYLYYTDKTPQENELLWKCPNLEKFEETAEKDLGWTSLKSREKCLPLITKWQIKMLVDSANYDTSDFVYEPHEIMKSKVKKGKPYFEVKWKSKFVNVPTENDFCITDECVDLFKQAYPVLSESYEKLQAEIKSKKTKSPKKKPTKLASDDRKVIPNQVNIPYALSPVPKPSIPAFEIKPSLVPNLYSNKNNLNSGLLLTLNEAMHMLSNKFSKIDIQSDKSDMLNTKSPETKNNISFVLKNQSFESSFLSNIPANPSAVDKYSKKDGLLDSSDIMCHDSLLRLEFSDSDDSFDVSMKRKNSSSIYSGSFNNDINSITSPTSSKFVSNVPYRNLIKENENLTENFCASLTPLQTNFDNFNLSDFTYLSPKPIFSIKSSLDSPANYCTTTTGLMATPKLQSTVMSTPITGLRDRLLKRNCLILSESKNIASMHLSNPVQIFSPILFDSSSDDSVICLN